VWLSDSAIVVKIVWTLCAFHLIKTMVLASFSVYLLSSNFPSLNIDDKHIMGICRTCTQENILELEKIYKLHCTMVEVLKEFCEISLVRPRVELSSVNGSYGDSDLSSSLCPQTGISNDG
jgi:hypothetical protein